MGVISDLAKKKEAAIEKWGVSNCEFCGELLDAAKPTEEAGEFYNPKPEPLPLAEDESIGKWLDDSMRSNTKTGHAQCGISAGWEIA